MVNFFILNNYNNFLNYIYLKINNKILTIYEVKAKTDNYI